MGISLAHWLTFLATVGIIVTCVVKEHRFSTDMKMHLTTLKSYGITNVAEINQLKKSLLEAEAFKIKYEMAVADLSRIEDVVATLRNELTSSVESNRQYSEKVQALERYISDSSSASSARVKNLQSTLNSLNDQMVQKDAEIRQCEMRAEQFMIEAKKCNSDNKAVTDNLSTKLDEARQQIQEMKNHSEDSDYQTDTKLREAHHELQAMKESMKEITQVKDMLTVQVEESQVILSNIEEEYVAMRNNIQEASRRSLISKYGTPPYFVKFSIHFPPTEQYDFKEVKGSFIVEMAPFEIMPHSIDVFLESVKLMLYDGCAFAIRTDNLVVLLPEGPTGENLLNNFIESGARMSPVFSEYSESYPHKQYSIGFTTHPIGPSVFISMIDNTETLVTKLDESGNRILADPCIGNIIHGIDTIDLINSMPRTDGWSIADRPFVTSAVILSEEDISELFEKLEV